MIDKSWFENTQSRDVLFSLDPTTSFVEYVQDVKPYHTKIFDVLINYAYSDMMRVNLRENIEISVEVSAPGEEPIYYCGPGYEPGFGFGYGIYWGGGYGGENSDTAAIPPPPATDDPYDDSGYDDVGYDGTVSSNPSNTIPPVVNVYAPIVQAVTGTSTVPDLPANSFLVTTPAPVYYTVSIINSVSNQLGFVRNYALAGVSPLDKKWVLAGDQTPYITAGTVFYTGAAKTPTGQFTIETISFNGTETELIVKEAIPLTAIGTGYISILVTPEYLPWWPYGMGVKLMSNDPLPAPLVQGQMYYFIPQDQPGAFNLATVRYPTKDSQYVDLSQLSNQQITLFNAETFVPGMKVVVQGSLNGRNDGNYTVFRVQQEGDKVRVWPVEPIMYPNDPSRTTDGWLSYDLSEGVIQYGFCPIASADDLFTQVYIGEKLEFRMEISFNDKPSVNMLENRTPEILGWGGVLFGSSYDDDEEAFTVTAVQFASVGGDIDVGNIILNGFDTRPFDLAPFDAVNPYTAS